MNAPIEYIPNFISNPDKAFQVLRDELVWEKREAPRHEYYVNDFPKPYIYGMGRGQREYHPSPMHPAIMDIRKKLEELTSATFEVCFLNRYLNQSDQLGWHSDNSPEMDDARPIGVISLGVEREIWFREYVADMYCSCCSEEGTYHKMDCLERTKRRAKVGEITKLKLGHGSLLLMKPGMQDTYQHRIPKASFQCGERISLTYRGYVQ
jgi:alkylated DNA repair dioxygenase AlkB